jgi:hypothetical protein
MLAAAAIAVGSLGLCFLGGWLFLNWSLLSNHDDTQLLVQVPKTALELPAASAARPVDLLVHRAAGPVVYQFCLLMQPVPPHCIRDCERH